jgi:hypothetical protein
MLRTAGLILALIVALAGMAGPIWIDARHWQPRKRKKPGL